MQIICDQPLTHPSNVSFIRVIGGECRLVTATKTNQIGCNYAMARSGQHWNHLAIKKAPCWFAMHAQHGARSGLGSRINVSNSKLGSIIGGHVGVDDWEIKLRYVAEC